MKKILPIFLFYTCLLSQFILAQDVNEQSDEEAIKTHVGVKVLKNAIKPLDKRKPTMEWLNPEESAETFTLELETKSPYPVKAIKVRVAGREVKLNKLSSLKKKNEPKVGNSRGVNNGDDYKKVSRFKKTTPSEVFYLPLALEDGESSIQIEVMNEGGMVGDTTFQTYYNPLPVLHLVTIGVGKYLANQLGQADAPKDLKYAAIDAEAIRDVYKNSKQNELFSNIKYYYLVDEDATKDAIDRLIRQKLKHSVKPGDLVILFLAAHGEERENEPLQFLPYDFDPDPNNKGMTGIDAQNIKTPIEAFKCNTVLIFDACQSGRAVAQNNLVSRGKISRVDKVTKIVRDNYSKNQRKKVILTASSESAYEHEDWGHGALTKAILEVLSGKVDSRFLPDSKNALKGISKKGKLLKTKKLMKRIIADGMIDVKELLGYVEHRVPELVGQKEANQMPVFDGDSDLIIFQLDDK